MVYTAISRKVFAKSACDIPERYCGWFSVHCSSKKFARMARKTMDVCLGVLKGSKKSRLDSYSIRNTVLLIPHITFRYCHMHIFSEIAPFSKELYAGCLSHDPSLVASLCSSVEEH